MSLEGVFVRGGCFCWLFFRLLDGIALPRHYRPPATEMPSGEGNGVFDPQVGKDTNEKIEAIAVRVFLRLDMMERTNQRRYGNGRRTSGICGGSSL